MPLPRSAPLPDGERMGEGNCPSDGRIRLAAGAPPPSRRGATGPFLSPSGRGDAGAPSSALGEGGEGPAFGGEALQQRGGLERLVARALRIEGEAIGALLQPHAVGVVHRPAAPDRPAI